MTPTPLVVLDVVGLTPALLARTPRIRAVGEAGFAARLDTVLPAVTDSAQATLLTGAPPREHGIVGSGWYARELGEVLLGRQQHALVGGEPVWAAARRAHPGYRVASVCWCYGLGAATDLTVTPLPALHGGGCPTPAWYSTPPILCDRLEAEFGPFPLASYWGLAAGVASTAWIAGAADHVVETDTPDLTLVCLPHLGDDLQRYGPDAPQAVAAAQAVDGAAGRVIDAAHERGATVVVLSGYGITPASRPVDINRALRRAGLLAVYAQAGVEELDVWTSRAFAVADHQVAHVYVRDPRDVRLVGEVLSALPGVGQVLDDEGKRAHALDHPRAGELVAVAEPGAWFTYYYWLDDERAPGFAHTADRQRKPGRDPAELLPGTQGSRPRGTRPLGGRWPARRAPLDGVPLDGVPLDPAPIAGTHGRLPDEERHAPVLLCSDHTLTRAHIHATEVKAFLLETAGLA